jgi:hypothetical protein
MATMARPDEIEAPDKGNDNSETVTSAPSTVNALMDRDGAMYDDEHVNIGWKTWMIVFITCFGYVILL